jgi:hypothetical protein
MQIPHSERRKARGRHATKAVHLSIYDDGNLAGAVTAPGCTSYISSAKIGSTNLPYPENTEEFFELDDAARRARLLGAAGDRQAVELVIW